MKSKLLQLLMGAVLLQPAAPAVGSGIKTTNARRSARRIRKGGLQARKKARRRYVKRKMQRRSRRVNRMNSI